MDPLPSEWAEPIVTADVQAVDGAIAALIAIVPTGSPAQLARSANAISAPMDELFALYDPAIPTAVLALDYLGREILLDGMDGDFARASSDLSSVSLAWRGLDAAVRARGGAPEAADFDDAIAAMTADARAGDGCV